MARARGIKPGFFRNADLAELPVEARLLFIGLWTLADREGRLKDRPKQIKMEIFPADNFDCDALLSSLADTGMLLRYEVDGCRYLQIKNFLKHQNPHRDEQASTLPAQGSSPTNQPLDASMHHASTMQAPCKPDASMMLPRLTPDSGLLTPDPRLLIPDCLTDTHSDNSAHEPIEPPSCVSSTPGEVCKAIKAEGIGAVNPQHPGFLALLHQGVTLAAFAESAKLAHAKGKGFAYLLGIVKGQLEDAKTSAQTGDERAGCRPIPGNAARSPPESFRQQDDRIARQRWEEMTGREHPDHANARTVPATVIDITPQPLELAHDASR